MDNLPENSHRSRYGIEKFRDHNYQNWSFQCRMLLSEKKVWKVVNGEHARPKTAAKYEAELTEEEKQKLTDTGRKKVQKEYDEWAEKDEKALRIISFTVSDQLQGPIHYGKTAKGA
jgi:hypothetical protein